MDQQTSGFGCLRGRGNLCYAARGDFLVSVTTFLSNETLWQTISDRVKAANHVDAAIAYFGQGGAKLLPLRSGHRLIVDMSPATVRAGATDPREIEKLIRRGVKAFTRRNLHAKIVVADNSVISGSANVSAHSQKVLDEAAILTTDQSAVRRAREFIDRLSIEPVRDEYLEMCKQIYKPPRFIGERVSGKNGQQRAKHAKLWLVNLVESSVPDTEIKRYEKGEAKAKKFIKDEARSTTDSFHWPFKPKMATELELGDWIIEMMTYKDKSIVVFPPGQLLFIDHYDRDRESGKERWVFHIEVPKRRETMTWKVFRKATKTFLGTSVLSLPRTKPIRDVQVADGMLGMWTASGRVSRR
jgi:PLD-like domain